jgi:hypothetical protein
MNLNWFIHGESTRLRFIYLVVIEVMTTDVLPEISTTKDPIKSLKRVKIPKSFIL